VLISLLHDAPGTGHLSWTGISIYFAGFRIRTAGGMGRAVMGESGSRCLTKESFGGYGCGLIVTLQEGSRVLYTILHECKAPVTQVTQKEWIVILSEAKDLVSSPVSQMLRYAQHDNPYAPQSRWSCKIVYSGPFRSFTLCDDQK
jgi:hypothetical protein